MPSRLGLAGCEMEVLRLAAAGRGNRDIGSELSMTPKTASVHVSDIGVSIRTEAAAVCPPDARHGRPVPQRP
jgi:DNA-binding CsgD family transcriptional regulator